MFRVDEQSLREIEDRLERDGLTGLWIVFHDYNARSCAKWIPRPYVPGALRNGGVFARANLNFSIDDQQAPNPRFGADTGDFIAIPDPETFAPVPYRAGVGRVFSFLTTEDGELWEGCPRGRLQSALDELANLGLSARAAFEPEFSLYSRDEAGKPIPADRRSMYSVDRIDQHFELLSQIETSLAHQHVRVIQIGSEYGAGQVEVNLHHELPLKAADDVLTLRDTARSLARDAGLIATFMPKPFAETAGNGLHIHLSLWDQAGTEDRSIGDGPFGVSDELQSFIAGILDHAPAICGVGAPTVNSYKRLQPASWAPAHVAYGPGNRSALVRIPGSNRPRVEFRAGDHTANPYLLLTAMIAAGVDGLRRELHLPAPALDDLGHAEPADLERRGIRMLPRTQREALDAIEQDEVVMDALGSICGPELLRIKRFEMARYEAQVSEWEREVYFERV